MTPSRRFGRSLKPFRRPWLWAGLWMLAIAGVVALSLLPPRDLPSAPLGNDKVGHFIAYFTLMAGGVQLYARRLSWVALAIVLVLLGIGMEWLQGAMHLGRSMDRVDALANTLGVMAGMATGFTPWRDLLWAIDSRA